MPNNPAFYVGTHHYSFRTNEPAEIIGVETCYPSTDTKGRICFIIKYKDGMRDSCPVSDVQNYKLLTYDEVRDAYVEKEI